MNIRDILKDLEIPFKENREHHHVSSGWVGIDCHRCSPGSRRFRLGIHTRTMACTCWTCGSARLGDVLAAASGRPLREILPRLGNLDADRAPQARPDGKYTPPPGLGPLLPAHRKYLARRHLDPDECAAVWGAGGLGDLPKLRWRVFLPVIHDRRPVSWTTRAVGNVEPRYISARPDQEARPLKSTLFGWQHITHTALVFEGPMDAMRVGPGACATCGVGYTPAQVCALSGIPRRFICFDNEPAAQRRARALADALAVWSGETSVVCLESAKDAADASADEIRELRELLR